MKRSQTAQLNDVKDKALRTHCIRCGTCCMKGGPTLHREDAVLCQKGILQRFQLYTLRKGEVVRNLDGTLMVLDKEMVKIKGQGKTWTCIFYDKDQGACEIYDNRPAECRAMKCWDSGELEEVMATPCLQRTDLINPGDGLLRLISAHEQRCAYEILESAVQRLQGADAGKAVDQVLDLLQYDNYMRSFLRKQLDLDPSGMEFLFGRPLTATIGMFGLAVKEQGDSLVLVPMD